MRVMMWCLVAVMLSGCTINFPGLGLKDIGRYNATPSGRTSRAGEVIPNTLEIYVVIGEDYTIKYHYLANYSNEDEEIKVDTFFRTDEGMVYILRHREGIIWRLLIPETTPGEHLLFAYRQ